LAHLISEGDLSAWRLANAITRDAESAQDYDRATVLEAASPRVNELATSERRSLAA
jgi:hypothetical protein